MITTKKNDDSQQKYMVECYYANQQQYRISPIKVDDDDDDKDNGIAEIVPIDVLTPAPSGKFYPLLWELMKRGDQTAAKTTEFLQSEQVAKATTMASKVLDHAKTEQSKLMEEATKAMEEHASKLTIDEETVSTQVKKVVDEQEIQQLFTMIKNEDLTVLLEKGKQRLEQLVQTDIPWATEQALLQTGIRVANDSDTLTLTSKTIKGGIQLDAFASPSSYSAAINKSRQLALESMQKLLDQAQVDTTDLEAIRESLGENFHTMFDSLTQAAKSDRYLANLLDTMSEHTAEWQEATGKLMATKSASLFLEGASRIQARAANLFSKDQLHWAGEMGNKFTKAFTEGDAAVARLKSIELGEHVRNRLVQAIEVRSESLGGLDGIIAGALTSMKTSSGSETAAAAAGDQMKGVLTTLQNRATSVTKEANETLLSVLAKRSEYRDVALLKVEQVMCDLDSQFGEELSAEDIAAMARGEGGTAKLFEPIAKRAAKEIEKQLDAAEESVSDQTMLDVLKHVRKIVSGELTLQAVLDDVVNILNDDSIVAAGENLMKQGEQVLDAIEGVSGNKVVDDVMQIAEKAGLTKDIVMEGIGKLDVNELLVRFLFCCCETFECCPFGLPLFLIFFFTNPFTG